MAERQTEIRSSTIAKVAAAAGIGSLIDWYDFFLAATAASLVWDVLYFKFLSGPAAVGAAIATYAITFFLRPVGAYIFGHFGDKLGRRNVLVYTLITVGVSVLGIAVTPGYLQIGIAAPILIIIFRAVFGLGMGGEFGGAQAWITEFVGNRRWRGFWNGLVFASNPLGVLLASAAFVAAISYTGQEFFTWGWRIPFGIGFVAVAVGALIRFKLSESPMFTILRQKEEVVRSPANEALKKYWKRIVTLAFVPAPAVASGVMVMQGPYTVAYGVSVHVTPMQITTAVAFGAIGGLAGILLASPISDVIGRRPVGIIGAVLTTVTSWLAFPLIRTANIPLIILALGFASFASQFINGVFPALLPEQFPTRYRYSASGLAFQIGALIAAIGAGVVFPAILAKVGVVDAWMYAALIVTVLCALAIISLLITKESSKTPLEQ